MCVVVVNGLLAVVVVLVCCKLLLVAVCGVLVLFVEDCKLLAVSVVCRVWFVRGSCCL